MRFLDESLDRPLAKPTARDVTAILFRQKWVLSVPSHSCWLPSSLPVCLLPNTQLIWRSWFDGNAPNRW